MLAAFNPQPLHELKPRDRSKIESLLAYGDRLLVGLNTGSLRIYRVNETSPSPSSGQGEVNGDNGAQDGPGSLDSPSKTRAVELLREEEKFGRRPVQQLAIIKEANLLVSLSDGYVSLHDLQTYGLVERLERTKGAGYFTVTSNVVKDAETGVPSLVSRLAVAVKRKVLVWTWRDMELEENVAEMSTEASVKSLTWVSGKNEEGALQLRLVVGMDAGFTLVDAEKPEEDAKPVYKPASRQDTTSGELAGVRFGAVSSSGMGYMGMGSWVPKPMATALSDGQVLLAKDVNTLFTDLEGRPLEKRQVPWALAPEAVGFSYPYLLALQPPEKGTLQIRNPATLSLLQTISVPSASVLHVPQPNISLAHAGKGFLVASERTIWRMNALPYPSQLDNLVEEQRFDEAISLLSLLEDTLIDDKLGRIREVKIQKAVALFRQQKYRPALDLFIDAEAPPERVIKLYPRSIAGELSDVPEGSAEEGEPGSGAEDQAKADDPPSKEPPVTPQKGVLSSFKRSHTRRDSDVASVHSSTTAPRTPGATEKEKDKPLEGDDLKFASRCLSSFLAQARGVQIPKFLSTDGTLKQDPPEFDSETNRPAFANLLPCSTFETDKEMAHIDWQRALLETAKLVDTTLFRAYMLASPSLAGPLFRLDNFCDPDVVQSSLYENDRYGDLVDFLHGKKLHREALEMLQKFGKGSPPDAVDGDAAKGEGKDGALHAEAVPEELNGPDRTVAYLRQLPPELIEIILEFVRWPLEVEPAKGMEVFLADSDYAERMPRDKAIEYLSGIDEKLETQYLEHIINELGDQTTDFHQRLIDLYLASLKASDPDISGIQREKLKKRLEDFLRKSKVYNKGFTFRQIPTDDPNFFETRAIVLSAMGNHKQALAIYVFQLEDYAKAEDYCNRIYVSQQANPSSGDLCLVDGTTTHHDKPSSFLEPEVSSHDQPNTFAMLLGLYLRPPASEEKRWPQALDLLSRHGARLPASSTLDLMPDDLAVSELQSYFRDRIRHSTSIHRQTSILKSLTAVQKVNTERHWLQGGDKMADEGKKGGRSRRVRITEEDHCRVCHKRFGASAVRVYPDNTVVHYGCVGKRPVDVVGAGGRTTGGLRGWA